MFKKIRESISSVVSRVPQGLNAAVSSVSSGLNSVITSVWDMARSLNADAPERLLGVNQANQPPAAPAPVNIPAAQAAVAAAGPQREQAAPVQAAPQNANASGSLTEMPENEAEAKSALDTAMEEIKADILGLKKKNAEEAKSQNQAQNTPEGQAASPNPNNQQVKTGAEGQAPSVQIAAPQAAGGNRQLAEGQAATGATTTTATPQNELKAEIKIEDPKLTPEQQAEEEAKAKARQAGLELGRLKGRGAQDPAQEKDIATREEAAKQYADKEAIQSAYNEGYNQGYNQGLAQKQLDIKKAREEQLMRLMGMPEYKEGQQAAMFNVSGDKAQAEPLMKKQADRNARLNHLKGLEQPTDADKSEIKKLEDETKAYNMAYNQTFAQAQADKVKAAREALLANPDFKAGFEQGKKIGELASKREGNWEVERNAAHAEAERKGGAYRTGYFNGYSLNFVNAQQKAIEDKRKELLKDPMFGEGVKAGKAAADLKVKNPNYKPDFQSLNNRDAKYRQGFYAGYNEGYLESSEKAVDERLGDKNPFFIKGAKIGMLMGNLAAQLGSLSAVEAKLRSMNAPYKTVDELKEHLAKSADKHKEEAKGEGERSKTMAVSGKGRDAKEIGFFEKGYKVGYNQGFPQGQKEALYRKNGLDPEGNADESDEINVGAKEGLRIGQEVLRQRMKAAKEGKNIEAQLAPQIQAAMAEAQSKGQRFYTGFMRGYNQGLITGESNKGNREAGSRVAKGEVDEVLRQLKTPLAQVQVGLIEKIYPKIKKEGYEAWFKYYGEVQEGSSENPASLFPKIRDKYVEEVNKETKLAKNDPKMAHYTAVFREAFNKGKDNGMKHGLSYRAGYWLGHQADSDGLESFSDVARLPEPKKSTFSKGIVDVLKPAGISTPEIGFFAEGLEAASQSQSFANYQKSIGVNVEQNLAWMQGPQYEQGHKMAKGFWTAVYYQVNGLPLPEELESEFGEEVKEMQLASGQSFVDFVNKEGPKFIKEHFEKAQVNFVRSLVEAQEGDKPTRPTGGEQNQAPQMPEPKEGENRELLELIWKLQGREGNAELQAFRQNFQKGYSVGRRSVTGQVEATDSEAEKGMIQSSNAMLQQKADFELARSKAYVAHYLVAVWETRVNRLLAAHPQGIPAAEIKKHQEWFFNFLKLFGGQALGDTKYDALRNTDFTSGTENRELIAGLQQNAQGMLTRAADLCMPNVTQLDPNALNSLITDLTKKDDKEIALSEQGQRGFNLGKATGYENGVKTANFSQGNYIFLGETFTDAERQGKRMSMEDVLQTIRQYLDESAKEAEDAQKKADVETTKEDAKAFGYFLYLESRKDLLGSAKAQERFEARQARKMLQLANKEQIKSSDEAFKKARTLVQQKRAKAFDQGRSEAIAFLDTEFKRLGYSGQEEENDFSLDPDGAKALENLLKNNTEVSRMVSDIAQRMSAVESDIHRRQKALYAQTMKGFDEMQIPAALAELPINSYFDFQQLPNAQQQQQWQVEQEKLQKLLQSISTQVLQSQTGQPYFRLDEDAWFVQMRGQMAMPQAAGVELSAQSNQAEASIQGPSKTDRNRVKAVEERKKAIENLQAIITGIEARIAEAGEDQARQQSLKTEKERYEAAVKQLENLNVDEKPKTILKGLSAYLRDGKTLDILMRDQTSAQYKGQEAMRLTAEGYRLPDAGDDLLFLGKVKIAMPVLEARLRHDAKLDLKQKLEFTAKDLSMKSLKTADSLRNFLTARLGGSAEASPQAQGEGDNNAQGEG